MAALTAFDVVVLLLVALAALAGLARGFVGEIVSLVAWVAGIAAVRFGHAQAQPLAEKWTGTEAGGAILAVVGLFLAGFLIVRIIGGQLSDTAKGSVIGPVDRLLGLGFGAAKGVLAAALLFLVGNLTFDTIDPGEPSPEWIAKARTAPTLAMVSKALVDLVEQQRHPDPDRADAADSDKTSPDKADTGDGYAPGQRSALDKLLDAQETQQPSTAI